jgi:DNA polymerase III delta subunit
MEEICVNMLVMTREEDTHPNVLYLWAKVDFIVEITHPKTKFTKLQEQLQQLTTQNWVHYYKSDKHKFIKFLKSYVQSPEDKISNFICNVSLYTKLMYDKIK